MNNAFMQQRMQLAALGSTANAYPWSSGVFNSLHSGFGGMIPYGMGTNFGGFGTGSGYYPGMMPGLGGYGAGFGGYGSNFGGMGGYGLPYGAGYGGYGGYGGGLGSSMAMGAGMTGLFYLLSGLFSSHAGYGAYGFGSAGYAPNAGAYSMSNYGVGGGGYWNAYGAGAPYSYDPNQPSSFPAYGYGYPNGGGQNGYPDPSAVTGYNAGGNSGYVAPFSGGATPSAPDVNAFKADGNNLGYPNNQMTGMVPNDGMAKLQEPNEITDNSNVSGYKIDHPNQLAYNPVNGSAYTGPQGIPPEQDGSAGKAQSASFTAKNYMLPNKNGWLNTYFQNQSPAYSYYMQHRSNALWMALAHDTGAPTTGENSSLIAKDEKPFAPDTTPDTTPDTASPFETASP
jgi:hypothetical protein